MRYQPFLMLMVSFGVLFIAQPLTSGATASRALFDLAFSAVLLVALGVCARRVRVGAVLAATAISLRGIALVGADLPVLPVAAAVASALYLGFVIYELLTFLFVTTEVTPDTLLGGAAVYLLLAVLWASLYAGLEVAQPGSMLFGETTLEMGRTGAGMSDLLYFSLGTLTTLGYGDLVPVSQNARYLAVLQAATGQLYLAVLVARLVGLHLSTQRSAE